jgi:hypothetical protein
MGVSCKHFLHPVWLVWKLWAKTIPSHCLKPPFPSQKGNFNGPYPMV